MRRDEIGMNVSPALFDGVSFDPFTLQQDGLAASEVDVGGCQVLQAFVVAPVIVVIDEAIDVREPRRLPRRLVGLSVRRRSRAPPCRHSRGLRLPPAGCCRSAPEACGC